MTAIILSAFEVVLLFLICYCLIWADRSESVKRFAK